MEKIKAFWQRYKTVIVIGFIFAICTGLLCSGRETTCNERDGNDVNQTMGAVEADNLGAGRAIRDAGDAIDRGQRELEETADRIDECEAIIEDSTERVDRRQAIFEDCRRNAERAKQIIEDIERTNKARAQNP